MAKNIKRHITHIKSKVVESGLPKLPAAADISEGEIAVNYAKGYETLSIKNESGDVVTFSEDKLIGSKGKLTGYAKASSAAAVATGDTINTAIGKLEKALDGKQASGSYVTTGRKINTASGLTGGGDLSADRTIGLAATGTAGTYYRVVVDAYGRVTSGNTTDANTDTAVTQTNTTANGSYEVLLAGSTATATTTEGSNKNVGITYNPSTSALTVNKKITTIAANNFITGTGTAATTGTSGTSTVYYPAKWTFNKGITVADGDIFTIKIPVAGHSYGVYISLNNGTNYYPVVLNGTGILTTHYPVNTYITVAYESTGTAAKIYPVTGGTATGTSAAGVFRVINFYDSNTTYSVVENTYLKYGQYKAATDIYRYQVLLQKDETSLLPINTVNNSTATTKTLTTEEFDPFGNILIYNVTATTNANNIIASGRTYQQILADLRYSFNAGKTLTANKSVYMVCVPQSNGKAKLHTSPISQTLPTTDDGLIYIYLGVAYNNYAVGITINHPIYQYKNGQIKQYVGGSDTISAITPSNSGSTAPIATKVVAENELMVSNALNGLNNSKADKIEDLDGIKLKKITQSAYDALVQAGTVDPNTLYFITD